MSYYNGAGIVRDGLVFCVDAASPKSNQNGISTLRELSKYNSVGTKNGDVSASSEGGGSWRFEGNEDYYIFPDSQQTSISGTDITLEAWVNLSVVSNGVIFGKSHYANGYLLHFDAVYESLPGGGIQTTNVNNSAWEWGVPLEVGEWTHIAYTYDGSTERCYKNGSFKGSKNYVGSVSANSSNPLYVGGYNSTDSFDGYLSVARVYDITLTANQILQNYNATKGRFGL